MLVFTSCAKESMVEPSCGNAQGTEKGLPTTHGGSTGSPDNGSTRGGDEPFIDLNGDGISDDGDDLSDTERKKR